MKVLVTGHNGYIGTVLMPTLRMAGHEATGLDSYLYEGCAFGEEPIEERSLRLDIRDVEEEHLRGFDAIIHLAALSNDPVGNLNPQCTYDINYHASVRLATLARKAGVSRFLFSSSCSNYGAGGDGLLDEQSAFNPVTPYGESKVKVEQELSRLADDSFSPTSLRNATAYGVSSRLRVDLVVNSLVGYAVTTGEVLILSDGSPWRPLVHVDDICNAFLAVLEAPRNLVHNEAFNVGRNQENLRVKDIAQMVEEEVEGSKVSYASDASPDKRNYRIDCSKIGRLSGFKPEWTVRKGIVDLHEKYLAHGLTSEEFLGSRYTRIKRIQELQTAGRLTDDLRWT
jgi:nucleoside-diphosphate-sugar epimerase